MKSRLTTVTLLVGVAALLAGCSNGGGYYGSRGSSYYGSYPRYGAYRPRPVRPSNPYSGMPFGVSPAAGAVLFGRI